jgi:hypothetical protein
MTIHEFADQIPVVTALGKGHALFVETTSNDHFWTIALDDNGAIVTLRQQKVFLKRSYSRGCGLGDAEMRAIVESACPPAKSSPHASVPRRRRR